MGRNRINVQAALKAFRKWCLEDDAASFPLPLASLAPMQPQGMQSVPEDRSIADSDLSAPLFVAT